MLLWISAVALGMVQLCQHWFMGPLAEFCRLSPGCVWTKLMDYAKVFACLPDDHIAVAHLVLVSKIVQS